MRHTKYDIRHTKDEPRVTSHESRTKHGVTLVEMLVVVAIIAILATMVISLAARIDSQGKERLTESTFALLNAALGEFQDYGYNYRHSDYDGFDFPLDCNDFSRAELEDALEAAPGAESVVIDPVGEHKDEYSGSEALYFFLSKVPESRKTLDKVDSSLIISDGWISTTDGREYPLLRIIDPWGETLQYSYYKNIRENDPSSEPDFDSPRTFPVIISAGPDRVFGTDDDIKSR